jgi:FAD/FMN-containing dehydrogenase
MTGTTTAMQTVNGRHSAEVGGTFSPCSMDQLQAWMRETQGPVRVVGGMYSVSSGALPPPGGWLLDLRSLRQVSQPEGDTIRVEAGATLRELLDALRGTGLQPGVVPLLGNFSIGAISGTPFYDLPVVCPEHAHFSTDVIAYTLVLADGSRHEVDAQNHPEQLTLLRTHQGLLGVVSEVRLRLYPTRMHTVSFESVPLATHLADPEQHRTSYLYVFPDSDAVIVERHTRHEEMALGTSDLLMHAYQRLATRLDSFCQRWVSPLWVPPLQRTLQRIAVLRTRLGGPLRLHPFDRAQIGPRLRPLALCDWQFDVSAYRRVLPDLLRLCRDHRQTHGYGPGFISVYTVPQNAAGAGYSSRESLQMSVDVVAYHPDNPRQHALEADWAALARAHGGRPSLNKNADAVLERHDVERIYGSADYARFRELCQAMDPRGRFRSPLLSRLFELPGPADPPTVPPGSRDPD